MIKINLKPDTSDAADQIAGTSGAWTDIMLTNTLTPIDDAT
jgi:hypothetical protein